MPNQNETKQKTALDASKMSGAEVLEAVGAAEPLAESLVHASDKKHSQTDSDMTKKIAEIQKQKMARIREALAAANASAEANAAPMPEETEVIIVPPKKSAEPKHFQETPAPAEAPTVVAVAEKQDAPAPAEAPTVIAPVKQPSSAPEESSSQTKKIRVKSVAVSDASPAPEQHEAPAPAVAPVPEEAPAPESSAKEPAPKESAVKPAKKKKSRKKRAAATGVIIGVSVAALAIGGYFAGAFSYQDKFLPHTYINTLAVDGMTTEEAHNALLEQKQVSDLTLITPKGEEVVFPAQDFKAEYTIPSGSLDMAANEGNFNWFSKLFTTSEYSVNYDYTYSKEDLKNLIQTYDWGDAVSTNARIVKNASGEFEIEPETMGDQFDTNMLINYVMAELEAGKNTIKMEDSGCYEQYRAKIKADDLQADLEVYNKYAKCNITFDFDDRKILLDSDKIISWLLTKEDGSFVTTSGHDIPIDRDGIAEFVSEMADETDTYGKDHEFYATLDGWITVPWTYASCYGWQIDQKATVNQIYDLIQDGAPVVVEPIYTDWGKGYTRQTDDIGTTYIEVDISAQHFWYYRDNEIIMDYDIVSGTETNSERRTPRGICQIVGHVAGRYLGTYEVQGYRQWVDFWMPFNYLGCGFHDLSRGAYGGSIYMYNGSHGCLNMRWSEAKALYNEIEDGLPVIVHD